MWNMFKVSNKDTRTLLLTLNILHACFSVSIVNFKQINAYAFVVFIGAAVEFLN